MKKTVSTAIGGVVFHIEEDAYQELSAYLDSVQRYFSAFSEGREIIQDIEARIAELLLARLKADDREAINTADVAAVAATMGTVADFAAAESEAEPADYVRAAGATTPGPDYQTPAFGQGYNPGPDMGSAAGGNAQGAYATPNPTGSSGPWQRTRRDRILAGVLGGMAVKMGIDALWVRVIFCVFFFGFWFLPAFPGFLLIAYVLLAFTLPKGELTADAEGTGRKLYREPQGQVIGGVAGGLAAYLRVDVTIVRLVLVAMVFAFGTGVGLYIILWICMPKAQTTADRMRMQGEPITLSGFNERMSSFTKTEPGQRNVLERILLLPFEALGAILRALGPVLLGLVRVVGALAGLLLLMLAFVFLVVGITGGYQLLLGGNLLDSGFFHFDGGDATFLAYFKAAPAPLVWAGIAVFTLVGIDLMMGGLSLIAARAMGGRYVNGTLIGMTLIAFITFLLLIPQAQRQFSAKARQETATHYSMPAQGMFTVAVPEVAAEGRFSSGDVSLHLRQADGDSITLVQAIEGSGANRQKALSAASLVGYTTRFSDDTLLSLSNAFILPEGKQYSMQRVFLTLNVPEGKSFRLTEEAARMASNDISNIDEDETMADRTFVFRRGKLACLDCGLHVERVDDSNSYDSEEEDTFSPHVQGDLDINGKSTHVDGNIEDVTINRHGIETIVRDKKTGSRMRVRIGGDSVEVKKQ